MKFPKEFFAEEERSGFVVPEMMKRAWAAELEVLEAVKSVCEKNDITYFAIAGTLLGAVRHKGFIPWDDDIDIALTRDQYDLFIEAAKRDLPPGFVLAGIHSDDRRLWPACEDPYLRVIADEYYFSLPEYMTFFHGFPYLRIGIDIFPYDYLPCDPDKQYDIVSRYYALNMTAAEVGRLKESGELYRRLDKFEEFYDVRLDREDDELLAHELFLLADKVISVTKKEEACGAANAQYLVPRGKENFEGFKNFKLEWIGQGARLPFENTFVNAPVMYKDFLAHMFGKEYMVPRKFNGRHEYPFYKRMEPELVRVLKESGVETPVDEFCRNWHQMCGGE